MQRQLDSADLQAEHANQAVQGAVAEPEREVDLASANSALDELRAELRLGPAPAVGSAAPEAPASSPSSAPPPTETSSSATPTETSSTETSPTQGTTGGPSSSG